MITIRVRRTATGFVGVTESDRWNLETLATPFANVIPCAANLDILSTGTASKLANYRKALRSLGFTLKIEPARRGAAVRAA